MTIWEKTTKGSYNYAWKRTAQKCLHLGLAHNRGSKNSGHYLNGVKTKAGSCFEISFKIVEKDGLRRLQAETLQAQLVNPGVRLTDTFLAGLHDLRKGQE